MTTLQNLGSSRAKLIKEIELLMGGENIDIELGQESLELAVNLALSRYRQRSGNSVEESYLFINLKEGQSDFRLPDEVVEVRAVHRKQFGATLNDSEYGAGQFDPFDLAYMNLYVLEAGNGTALATYDFYAQNIELAAKMFGYHYLFSWNNVTKKLRIHRNIRRDEEIMCHIYNYIPDENLLKDNYASSWIRSYAQAQAQLILGKTYSKFPSLAGPQGGITLNGDALINEANTMIEKLDEEIKKYAEGSRPMSFIIG